MKGTQYEMFYDLSSIDSDDADSESYTTKKKEIGYEEFADAMRNTLNTQTWPKRENNIPDW